MYISAKTGQGVDKIFEAVIERIPPPDIVPSEILKCFLFAARYVPNRGVACLIKVMSGTFNIESVRQLMSFHNAKRYEIYEAGIVQPDLVPTGLLKSG